MKHKQKKQGLPHSIDDALLTLVTLVRMSPAGVIILDERGCISVINERALALLNIEGGEHDIIGKPFLKYLEKNPDLAKRMTAACAPQRQSFAVPVVEVMHGKKSMFLSVTGDASSHGCVVVIEDVSHRYDELNRIKTEFVSMASHQLRTPLTAVRWYLEELLDEQLGTFNKTQREYIDQALDSTNSMISLVRNLLNIARLEAGRVTVDPKLTDIIKVVQTIIGDHSPLARAKNCSIEFHRPKAHLPKIKVDPALMTQVVANLLSNAIKYGAVGPGANAVHVYIEQKNDEVLISVVDSGVGIPREAQHRIFEKFFRADNVFKLEAEGTGLGLYIAKLIVEASGGRIWFESPPRSFPAVDRKKKAGTVFVIALPIRGSRAKKGERALA